MRKICTFLLLSAFSIAYAEKDQDNKVVKSAKSLGVEKCLPLIKEVSDFIIGDHDYGYNAISSKTSPNKEIFVATIAVQYPSGNSIADIVIAPTPMGGCNATYSQSIPFNMSCIEVANTVFTNAKFKKQLTNDVTLFETDAPYIYFNQTQNGCIVVKNEVIYQ